MGKKQLVKEIITTIQKDMENEGFIVHNNKDNTLTIEMETDTVPVDVCCGVVCEDDRMFVHVTGANFFDVPEKMTMSLFILLSELNSESLFVKYAICKELDQLTVSAEALAFPETCAQTCKDLIIRVAAGAEYCYPVLRGLKSKN